MNIEMHKSITKINWISPSVNAIKDEKYMMKIPKSIKYLDDKCRTEQLEELIIKP